MAHRERFFLTITSRLFLIIDAAEELAQRAGGEHEGSGCGKAGDDVELSFDSRATAVRIAKRIKRKYRHRVKTAVTGRIWP